MENNNIHFSLREIGLSDKEIDLYLAALKTGECGMSELSRLAGIKRTSAYLLFTSLEKKGLIGSFKSRRGKRFVAKEPRYLIEKAKTELSTLSEIMPSLEALSNINIKKPKITYYEGVEDYVRVIEECLLKPHTTIRHIGSLSEGHKTFSKEYDLQQFIPKRIKNHIFLKALYTSEMKEVFNKESPFYLREVKCLPINKKIKTLTLIHENKVIISTSRENLGIMVIESEEIATAEKEKFDLLWNLIK
ncbi:MAG TPA: helix-turn-helix domain-containing protein [bacterium]|jgi:sugar-specific transcriptional regulator TrmB|nr:helix-turn-helix domain-containing protein [bacterium]